MRGLKDTEILDRHQKGGLDMGIIMARFSEVVVRDLHVEIGWDSFVIYILIGKSR